LKRKIAVVFGTRPEAIKLAPVIKKIFESDILEPVVISTGQHREMLKQVLKTFEIKVDHDLDVMVEKQTLPFLTARLLEKLDKIFQEVSIDFTLVQGDTTTTFAAALISFYHKIPIGHVEAGLRTLDIYNPFPEEANRRLTSVISTLQFAPTEIAKQNLIEEGFDVSRIFVTGNTVVDSLKWVINNKSDLLEKKFHELLNGREIQGKKLILLTMHRRENWGTNMKNALLGVKDVLGEKDDVFVVFPVHLNPIVRETVFSVFDNFENIMLTDPVDYITMISLMKNSYAILTDSGGIQEEAPTFRKPVLILRTTTERPEIIKAGCGKLIGTDRKEVYENLKRILEDQNMHSKMSKSKNPFGDGRASERIINLIEAFFKR
jgi:UDP-N-acetylglucosamine 2-epimerase (non-hydrolysing)